MSTPAAGAPLPLVVAPHGYRSVPALQLAGAAEGICRLAWLVSGSDPEIRATGRLLGRLGPVVDVDGLAPHEIAGALAAYEPAGIVAFRDEDLVLAAELAGTFGLSFHKPEVAARLVDKVAQRRALAAAGLAVPGFWDLADPGDVALVGAVAAAASYPAVVKPRAGSGSRHTFLVHSPAALRDVCSGLASDAGDSGPMIVEEYLPSGDLAPGDPFADYVSVETLVTTGGRRHVAVTGRLRPAEPFRETGFFIPSRLGDAERDAVLATASAALDALGVRVGCTHTEIKLTPDGPRVIEVNGRMGGGVRELLLAAAGEDLLAAHLRSTLGQPVAIDGLLPCHQVGFRLFHQPPLSALRVTSMGDLRRIASLPGVTAVSPHLGPGDPVDGREGTRSFLFSVVGAAPNHDEVARIDRLAFELAAVTYDTGAPAGAPAGAPTGALVEA